MYCFCSKRSALFCGVSIRKKAVYHHDWLRRAILHKWKFYHVISSSHYFLGLSFVLYSDATLTTVLPRCLPVVYQAIWLTFVLWCLCLPAEKAACGGALGLVGCVVFLMYILLCTFIRKGKVREMHCAFGRKKSGVCEGFCLSSSSKTWDIIEFRLGLLSERKLVYPCFLKDDLRWSAREPCARGVKILT